jgi:hypothetical protein
MPEPGYNEGDAPPLWVWVIGFLAIIAVLLMLQSC